MSEAKQGFTKFAFLEAFPGFTEKAFCKTPVNSYFFAYKILERLPISFKQIPLQSQQYKH